MLAPNVVSVRHWQRLLGGVLYSATPRVDWATLLRRSFEADVLACPSCGGRLRVLGEITDVTAVRLVLDSRWPCTVWTRSSSPRCSVTARSVRA
jgi:hypothetical protein